MKEWIFAFVAATALILLTSQVQANPGNAKGGNLPPGLEKKAQSGKPLPPGWQKNSGLELYWKVIFTPTRGCLYRWANTAISRLTSMAVY